MPSCIFCGKALSHATPPEHVLLDCLGGRKKTKRVICAACNRALGGSLDASLARDVEGFRAAWHLPSGSRRRWPDAAPDPTPPRFDQPRHLRSIAKMGLMLWTDRLGTAELSKPCWSEAKRMVMAGTDPIPLTTPLLAPTSLLVPPDFGPLSHRLWVISDHEGRVMTGASLYGQPGQSLLLCDGGAEPGLRLLLLADPTNPAHWHQIEGCYRRAIG